MEIKPVSFDSFSVRSSFTIVKTDISIFIDPSVAIAPKRYNLPPSKEELVELEKVKNFIINNYIHADIFVITHYHWDHCPYYEDKHFEIFKSKNTFFIKDYYLTNKSQKLRALKVLKKAKLINKNFQYTIADFKKIEMNNTLIEFTKPLDHGPKNSVLGKVIGVYIEYKKDSLLFASDIQGILTEETLNEIVKFNPKILIMSGPATYHYKWKEEYNELNNANLKKLIEKTNVKKIVIDHHLLRDLKYKEKLKEIKDYAENFGVDILTAAELINKPILQLEARRKELINNQ